MENKPLNRIKVMLAERMVSNKDLAEMLGKDPATISKWVTNTSQPTLENLIEKNDNLQGNGVIINDDMTITVYENYMTNGEDVYTFPKSN